MQHIDRNEQILDSHLSQNLQNINLKTIQFGKTFEIWKKAQILNNDLIIQLYKVYGNHWKTIGDHFYQKNAESNEFRDESVIKNKFYTLLRNALRKINRFIKTTNKIHKQKNKSFKLNCIFKLTNLAESERSGISPQTHYTSLVYNLLKLKDFTLTKIKNNQNVFSFQYFEETSNDSIYELSKKLRSVETFFIEHKLNKTGNSKKRFSKKSFIKAIKYQKLLINQEETLNLQQNHQIQQSQMQNYFEQFNNNLQNNQIHDQKVQLLDFGIQQQFLNINESILLQNNVVDTLLFT